MTKERENISQYDKEYALRYISTITTAYSQLKYQEIADAILSHIPQETFEPITIVDIGGNIGGTIKERNLAGIIYRGLRGTIESKRPEMQLDYRVVDVDSSYFDPAFLTNFDPSSICYPREQIKGIVEDARETTLPDKSADFVVLADALEHIEEPEKVLQEANRILKPNGKLILVSPSFYKRDVEKAQNVELRQRIEDLLPTSGHVNFFDHASLTKLLHKTNFNFNTDEIQGIGYASGLPYLLWLNEKYIVRNYSNPKTQEEKDFVAIREQVQYVSPKYQKEIDKNLNDPKFGKWYFSRFIKPTELDPLGIISEVLSLHIGAFTKRHPLYHNYEIMSEQVHRQKHNFDQNSVSDFLKDFLQKHPYQYLANSVLIQARKN